MPEPTVIVKLRGTFRYLGVSYGPGAAVAVPLGLARVLGLTPIQAEAPAPKRPPRKKRGA